MPDDNRNISVGKSWPRPATPCDLVPNWEGEFRDFQDWVSFAHKRLTVASDSNGAALSAICVDTLGRRCHNGRDMMRARDEGTFPVRYFFECREGTGTIAALRAVEAAMMRKPDGSLADAGWNIAALTRARPLIHAALAGAEPPLPQDVIDLVIAAREAWEEHGFITDDLERALERFSARVPYANQPDEVPQ